MEGVRKKKKNLTGESHVPIRKMENLTVIAWF
jgi:hypothetical protein